MFRTSCQFFRNSTGYSLASGSKQRCIGVRCSGVDMPDLTALRSSKDGALPLARVMVCFETEGMESNERQRSGKRISACGRRSETGRPVVVVAVPL